MYTQYRTLPTEYLLNMESDDPLCEELKNRLISAMNLEHDFISELEQRIEFMQKDLEEYEAQIEDLKITIAQLEGAKPWIVT